MLDGLAGAFFRPLALSYVLAILASLGVALTITPALALLLLPKHLDSRESRLVAGLKARYRRMLPAIVERPRTALGALAVMLLLTAAAVPFLGEEFLPNFREYDFLMHWVEKPGTSLDAMRRITERASRELMAVPGVRNFGSHIGRAEVADEVVGPNFTELWISLDPAVDYEATVARIQSIVDGYPGLYRDLLTYLRERIKEVLTGASATVVVRVYGPELDQLRSQAQAVRSAIADVSGVVDLKVQAQVLVPKIDVRFDPERAAAFGLTPGQVRRAAATLIQGTKVGEFYEDQRLFDVVVWGTPDVRRNLDAIRTLQVPVGNGGLVPLSSVAHVEVTPTPNEITRENGSRRIDVTSNVRGRDLGAVARDVQAKLAAHSFPPGYYAEVLGEYAERQASSTRLLLLGIGAVAAIFLILLADFGSAGWRAGVPDAALRAGRRDRGDAPDRRRALARVAGRTRHGHRHLGAQRHHAGEPLSPSRSRGRHAVRPRSGHARLGRASGAHPDDGARHRPRPGADRARRQPRRLRDRASAGGRDPGRAGDVDAPQPVHRAVSVSAIRAARAMSTEESI